MNNDDLILEGDNVAVFWDNIPSVQDCRVMHVPAYPGDFWILRENKTKHLHYVLLVGRITKSWRKKQIFEEKIPGTMEEQVAAAMKNSVGYNSRGYGQQQKEES